MSAAVHFSASDSASFRRVSRRQYCTLYKFTYLLTYLQCRRCYAHLFDWLIDWLIDHEMSFTKLKWQLDWWGFNVSLGCKVTQREREREREIIVVLVLLLFCVCCATIHDAPPAFGLYSVSSRRSKCDLQLLWLVD